MEKCDHTRSYQQIHNGQQDKISVNTKQKENKSDGLYASLDPGVRKFQTIYSPDKEEFIMIGKGAGKVLYQHLLRLDKMLSKRNSKNELKIKKLRIRINDLQSELHFKTSNFLDCLIEQLRLRV